jgi:hypothetical protein
MNSLAMPIVPGAPAPSLEVPQSPGQNSGGSGGNAGEGGSFDAVFAAQVPEATSASANPAATIAPAAPVTLLPALAGLLAATAPLDTPSLEPDSTPLDPLGSQAEAESDSDSDSEDTPLGLAVAVPHALDAPPVTPLPQLASAPTVEDAPRLVRGESTERSSSGTSGEQPLARSTLRGANSAASSISTPRTNLMNSAKEVPAESLLHASPELAGGAAGDDPSQPAAAQPESPAGVAASQPPAEQALARSPLGQSEAVLPTPASAQPGKIDSAISAEILPLGRAGMPLQKSPSPSDPDKYSVSGRKDSSGTRHAKGEHGMKTLPFPPSSDEVSSPRLAGESLDGVAAPKGAGEREAGADSQAAPGGDAFAKIRPGEMQATRPEALFLTGDAKSAAPAARADIAHAYNALHAVLEKTLSQPGAPSRIEIELPVQDAKPVRVRLELRNDEIQAVFRTDSPELRDALQQAWPQFSQRSHDRGLPLGEARFESSLNSQTSQEQQQQQNPSRQSPRESSAFAPEAPRAAKTTSIPVRKVLSAGAAKLSLWA